jgi:hypothetical protein
VLDGVGAEPDQVFSNIDENVRRALVVGRAFEAAP